MTGDEADHLYGQELTDVGYEFKSATSPELLTITRRHNAKQNLATIRTLETLRLKLNTARLRNRNHLRIDPHDYQSIEDALLHAIGSLES